MPSGPGERYDFFLSRRGSVAAIAREVTDVLTDKGYRVRVQDYDIPIGASFVAVMHEGVKNSRDLIVLFTQDYEQSPYTRKEFTSFEAERAQSAEERHIIVLRCEDTPLRGLLADSVYQDLVGIEDPQERKRRIIAAAERQSQAASPPPRPFIGVPPRIASFTGRAGELDKLDAILMHEKPAAVTQASVGRAAVQGMGGVGKTSLAIEYAHRYRNLYAGVCWCPSETRTGLLSVLANLAVTLGATRVDEADVEKTAKAALRRLAEHRATWLLVYDNVTSPDEIADLLPSAGARVLITTRFSDWGGLADEVSLDVLPPEEAVTFLHTRTGRNDPPGAKTLTEALGHLPLALDHAAAYCKRTQMRFSEYAAKASSLIATVPRGAGYPRSVAATFDLAISEAVAQCAWAEALMAFLAQCAPERIPMLLVEGAVEDEAERMEALAALAEVSLVKHDPFEDGTSAVTVHRLVQAVARARSGANGSTQDAVGRLIERLAVIYPEEGDRDPGSLPVCAQLTPHVLTLRGADHGNASEGWLLLLRRTGSYFYNLAAYSQAALVLRDAVAIDEQRFGPEHPNTVDSLMHLAGVLHEQGDLVGAEPLYDRILEACLKAVGPGHPKTAETFTRLAYVHEEKGDLEGARSFHQCALAIREKVLGHGHFSTALSLGALAGVLYKQGDLAGARKLYERALAISEKAAGPESPATAAILSNLAKLLIAQGDLAGARKLYERALAINEKAVGSEQPSTALFLENLAELLQLQGEVAGARPLFERALAIHQEALGPEHPWTNRARCHLSRLLLAIERPTEALALGETALTAHDKAFGRDHASTKDSARVTADALDALGRAEEAKALRERYGLDVVKDGHA